VRLKFARGWLPKNPLTKADLARERGYLRKAGIGLRFS
jgi:hypothetical protein